jgi:hypothetical protein
LSFTNTKVYDGTLNAVFTFESSDIISGDNVAVSAVYDDKNVGTGKTITYTLGESSDTANYKFGADGTAEAFSQSDIQYTNGEITARVLALSWTYDAENNVYDGLSHVCSLVVDNIITGDDVGISGVTGGSTSTYTGGSLDLTKITYTFNNTDAGSYSANVSVSNANYVISANAGYSWSIAKRPITVTWYVDGVSVTEYTKIYDAQEISVTHTVSNIAATDTEQTLDATVTGAEATNAGDYTARFAVNNGNYTVSGGATLLWHITKATITGVNLGDVSAVYDGQAHTVSVNTQYSQHGILLPVVYTITPEGSDTHSAVTVGSYTVTASASNANYYTLNVPNTAGDETYATLTITPADITNVAFDGLTAVYNAQVRYIYIKQDGAEATGATVTTQAGDEVGITYAIATENGATEGGIYNGAKHVGIYTVTATVGADNGNYNTLVLVKILTITKAEILGDGGDPIEIGSYTGVYDRQLHSVSVNASDGAHTQY